jgi:broad specificity phosphatase PhoE
VGVLLLVRHGQASLGTPDYDRLSDLGYRQARSVGARLAHADASVQRVWCGGLVRQQDTAREAMAELGIPLGDLGIDDRLDEYDHVGVLAGHGTGDPFTSVTTPESRRALQPTLDEAISRWIQAGAGYPETHSAFTARVAGVFTELSAMPGTTMAVTSAGVIAVACAQLVGLGAEGWPALARVIVNTSITKLITGRTGTHLLTFNDHAHLEGDRSLITYR